MEQNLRKDFIWNTLGSLLYALSAALLAFAALSLAGPEDGGIFGFGYSTLGQQLFIVAYFGIRPFHVTDTLRRFSYEDFRTLRRLSAGLACILGAVFLLLMFSFSDYTPRKCMVLSVLALIKITDGIADLYESECQRIGKLYIAGMELSFRTLFMCFVMTGSLLVFRDIFYASLLALLSEAIVVAGFKYYLETRLLQGDTDGAGCRALFNETFIIFISVFLDFYVFSASKYAVDLSMTDADNGIFNLLFMPTSLIYLAANFVIRPYLSRLSLLNDRKDALTLRSEVKKLARLIAFLGAAAFICTLFLAAPVLYIAELVLGAGYRGALTGQSTVLMMIIAGGAFYALSSFYYYVLVILRRQKDIFFIYLLMALLSSLVSLPLVKNFGLRGAGAGYVTYMFVMMLLFSHRAREALS